MKRIEFLDDETYLDVLNSQIARLEDPHSVLSQSIFPKQRKESLKLFRLARKEELKKLNRKF